MNILSDQTKRDIKTGVAIGAGIILGVGAAVEQRYHLLFPVEKPETVQIDPAVIQQLTDNARTKVGAVITKRMQTVIEAGREDLKAEQDNNDSKAFYGDHCEAIFYAVQDGVSPEAAPSQSDGYSVQELITMDATGDELPFSSTAWGEYQDGKQIGGFTVDYTCVPSGARQFLREGSSMDDLERGFAQSGMQKSVDLSGVITEADIAQEIAKVGVNPDGAIKPRVVVFFRD